VSKKLTNEMQKNLAMEPILNNYISTELVTRREQLPIQNDTELLKSGILDSLSVLKLVFFVEQRFGITVNPDEVVPQNFNTISAICNFLHNTKGL
jgi:acyl carrier protein